MSEAMGPTRRAKRLLSAEQKYEIWLKILCGELTTNEAAVRAGVGAAVPPCSATQASAFVAVRLKTVTSWPAATR